MSPAEHAGAALERRHALRSASFERPAELVDISERIYRQVFATGMGVAATFSAFAALISLLQPSGSQLRGLLVCAACLAAAGAGAARPLPLYRLLRRHPWALLAAAASLGVGAVAVGAVNYQMFLPIASIIGVLGLAAPLRMVASAGLIGAIGLAAPQIVGGHSNPAEALAVVVPPLVFWLIVDRIAGFALRLHLSLDTAPSAAQSSRPATGGDNGDGQPPRRGDRSPRALPEPEVIEVDGVRMTSRQLQVVLLACEDLKHAEIGACLGLGAQQVRRHLKSARERTGSVSNPQLVAWARRAGLAPRSTGVPPQK